LEFFTEEAEKVRRFPNILLETLGTRLAFFADLAESNILIQSDELNYISEFILDAYDSNALSSVVSMDHANTQVHIHYKYWSEEVPFDLIFHQGSTISNLEKSLIKHRHQVTNDKSEKLFVGGALVLNNLGQLLHRLFPSKWSKTCGNIVQGLFLDPFQFYLIRFESLLLQHVNVAANKPLNMEKDDVNRCLLGWHHSTIDKHCCQCTSLISRTDITLAIERLSSISQFKFYPKPLLVDLDTESFEVTFIRFIKLFETKQKEMKQMWLLMTGHKNTRCYYASLIKENGKFKTDKNNKNESDSDEDDEDDDDDEEPLPNVSQEIDLGMVNVCVFNALESIVDITIYEAHDMAWHVSCISPDFIEKLCNSTDDDQSMSAFEHWIHWNRDQLSKLSLVAIIPESRRKKMYGRWTDDTLRHILYGHESTPMTIGCSNKLIIVIPSSNLIDHALSWLYDTKEKSGLPMFTINNLKISEFELSDESSPSGRGVFKTWFSRLTSEIFSPKLGVWKKLPNNVYIIDPLWRKMKNMSLSMSLDKMSDEDDFNKKEKIVILTGILILLHNMCGIRFPYRIASFYTHWGSFQRGTMSRVFFDYNETVSKNMSLVESASSEKLKQMSLTNSRDENVDSTNVYDFILEELDNRFSNRCRQLILKGIQDICKDKSEIICTLNTFCLADDVGDFLFGKQNFSYDTMHETCVYVPSDFGESNACKWFWEVCREIENEQLIKLYQFITSTTVFAEPITLSRVNIPDGLSPTSILPRSASCFSRLDLPQYASRDLMRSKLLTVIECCDMTKLTEA